MSPRPTREQVAEELRIWNDPSITMGEAWLMTCRCSRCRARRMVAIALFGWLP